VRAKVWRRAAATTGTAPVVLDIDGSLHQIHSETEQEAVADYKRGYGFHPIYCFADTTGETLAVPLRPGNAAVNSIADHVARLDAAIARLPAEIAVGHHPGDDARLVRRPIQVRTDSAGCTGFVWYAQSRNVGFAVIARSNAGIHAAISRVAFRRRRLAAGPGPGGRGAPRRVGVRGHRTLNLSAWPSRTR
jgi:hypothetical protein